MERGDVETEPVVQAIVALAAGLWLVELFRPRSSPWLVGADLVVL